MKWAKKQTGFTIVELLIVIVVIAILAAVTIVAYNGIANRAKVSAAQSAAQQAAKKISLYAIENADSFPADLATIGIADSDNTTYQYSTASNAYCVTVSVLDVSYFVSNTQVTPQSGGCPGHGQNGVAAVTNLVTNPSFETGGANVEVWRNLATNPNAVTATGFSSNNGATWTVTKETVGVSSNPQGILSRAKSVLNGAQSTNVLLSMYNVDGLVNTGPARSIGAWFYVTASGYEASIGTGSSPKVTIPANTWIWVTGSVPASTYSAAYVTKAAGQGNAGASDIAYITGVTALVGATPSATIAGGITTLDVDLTASWTGAANASESIATGVSASGAIAGPGAAVIRSQKWTKDGQYSVRIISKSTTNIYARLAVGTNSPARGTFLLSMHRDTAQPDRGANTGIVYWNPVPQPMSPKWLAAGNSEVRVYGDPHPSGSGSEIIVLHNGHPGDPDLFVDNLLRVEGNYSGAYHDGTNQNWIWNGTPHASTSTGPGQ